MSDSWYGPPGNGEPAPTQPYAYGEPAAQPTTGQPNTEQQQYTGQPYAYGTPYPYAEPQQTPATALQPYSPGPAQQYTAVQPYQAAPYPAHQAPAFPLVSAGGRLGALLLDMLLVVVTLWIGWFIWAMFTWGDGQTPGKKLLGHVVADAGTGEAFGWGRMALREFVVKGLLGWVLNVVSIGIYFWVDSLMILGDRQRTLHDRMANSIVRHS